MTQDFIIPLNGLSAGKTTFKWHADGEFFGSFENSEILDADLDVVVTVEKSGRYIGVDCALDGTVTVACDRCLEDLTMPVHTVSLMSVKFGEQGSVAEVEEGDREIVMLPESDTDLDLSQVVYDYAALSLPMQRVHPEGECNPDAVKYLSTEEDEESDETAQPLLENPFAGLKDMLENKR